MSQKAKKSEKSKSPGHLHLYLIAPSPSIPPDPKQRGQRRPEDVQAEHAALLPDAVGVQGGEVDAQEAGHARGDVVLVCCG